MSNWNLVRYSRSCISRFKNPHQKNFFFFFCTSINEEGRTAPTENPIPPGPPPVRVALTESAGRGVFATRRIGAGELLHTAKPLVSHSASLSTLQRVCCFCLRKLGNRNVSFCSEECEERAKVCVCPQSVWWFVYQLGWWWFSIFEFWKMLFMVFAFRFYMVWRRKRIGRLMKTIAGIGISPSFTLL